MRSPTRPPRGAAPDLLALSRWEEVLQWLLATTGRWPKTYRQTLTTRLENHALDVLELLVRARYEPGARPEVLQDANLTLERMRFLLRVARQRGLTSATSFEKALRHIDETGRMIGGWRKSLGANA